jgi:general secretion pathway protein H
MGPRGAARPAGFTLLEMLVALAVAALLLAVALPRLVVPTGVGLRAATDQVATGLRQARLAAIRGQRPVALLMNVDTRVLQVEGTPRLRTLPRDVQLEVVTAQGMLSGSIGGIRFFPDGSSTGGRVTLRLRGLQAEVGVEWLTGRIHVREDGA